MSVNKNDNHNNDHVFDSVCRAFVDYNAEEIRRRLNKENKLTEMDAVAVPFVFLFPLSWLLFRKHFVESIVIAMLYLFVFFDKIFFYEYLSLNESRFMIEWALEKTAIVVPGIIGINSVRNFPNRAKYRVISIISESHCLPDMISRARREGGLSEAGFVLGFVFSLLAWGFVIVKL